MGNGIPNCRRFSDCCRGGTNIEINNNIYGNPAEMNLGKIKAEQGIITNIIIPNYKIEFSPEDSNMKQKTYSKQHNSIKLSSNQIKINLQKNFNNDSKEGEGSNNNFTHFANESNKNEKNVTFISPSISMATTMHNNNNNNKISFNKYSIEMLNYLNKVRNNPKAMIEEIDNMI